MPRPSKLSASAADLVLKELKKNIKPLSAYDLLEKLRKTGIKSPPIVYRALENLTESGKVHKINELNTYVACDCEDDHKHSLSVIMVCQRCNKVNEAHDHALIKHFEKLSKLGINLAEQAVIELPVVCCECES